MKKKLVATLAAAMILGVAGTSFAAANPFSDVPAKHWAYASVMNLSQAGIVDGYGDGTYKGDKVITRYEMAQMVAKAMARSDKADAKQKAEIDKLATEFSEELNVLGVRVSKLEKNASSIKFSGDSRLRYTNNYNGVSMVKGDANDLDRTQMRIRVKGEANVADNVSLTFRIAGQNKVADNGAPIVTKVYAMDGITQIGTTTQKSRVQNDQLEFDLGYFTFKNVLGGSNLSVGRTYLLLGQGLISDAPYYDAVRLSGGKVLKYDIGFGDNKFSPGPVTNNYTNSGADSRAIKTLNLSYDMNSKLNLTAAALYSGTTGYNYEVQAYGFKGKLSPDFTLTGEYVTNKKQTVEENGKWVKLMYKGATKANAGTYGVFVDYRKIGGNAIDGYTTLNNNNAGTGFGQKGFTYGGNYAIAKNTIFSLEVEPLESYNGTKDYKTFTNARVEWSF